MSNAEEKPVKPFMSEFAEKNHPVATFLLNQWTIFKAKQEKAVEAKSKEPANISVGLEEGEEHFVNAENAPVVWEEVGELGNSYLAFLKEELGKKNWGGKFNYNMAGLGKKGHMVVKAEVDTGDGPASTLELKPFFYMK